MVSPPPPTPSQVPPYISWTAAEAGSVDGLHWAAVAWFWHQAVATAGGSGDFLLVQGPEAVDVGRLVAWWRPPPNVLFVTTRAGQTPAEALARADLGRQDPCPADPYLLPQLIQAVTDWEPLWIPTNNRVRHAHVQLLAERRRQLAEREARRAQLKAEREARPPSEKKSRKRRRAAEEEPAAAGGAAAARAEGEGSGDEEEEGEEEEEEAPPAVAAESAPRRDRRLRPPAVGSRHTQQPAEGPTAEDLEALAEAEAQGAHGDLPLIDVEQESEAGSLAEPALPDIQSQERDVAGEYTVTAAELATGILGAPAFPPTGAAEADPERAAARSAAMERARRIALSQQAPGAGDLRYHPEPEDVGPHPPADEPAPRRMRTRSSPGPAEEAIHPGMLTTPMTVPKKGPLGPRPPQRPRRPPLTMEQFIPPRPTRTLPDPAEPPPRSKRAKAVASNVPPAPGSVTAAREHAAARSGRGPAPAAAGKPPAPSTGSRFDLGLGAPGGGGPAAAEAKPAAPPADPAKPPASPAKAAAEAAGGGGGRTTLTGAVAQRLAGLTGPPTPEGRPQRGQRPAGDKDPEPPKPSGGPG